jgi:hypothetical protein
MNETGDGAPEAPEPPPEAADSDDTNRPEGPQEAADEDNASAEADTPEGNTDQTDTLPLAADAATGLSEEDGPQEAPDEDGPVDHGDQPDHPTADDDAGPGPDDEPRPNDEGPREAPDETERPQPPEDSLDGPDKDTPREDLDEGPQEAPDETGQPRDDTENADLEQSNQPDPIDEPDTDAKRPKPADDTDRPEDADPRPDDQADTTEPADDDDPDSAQERPDTTDIGPLEDPDPAGDDLPRPDNPNTYRPSADDENPDDFERELKPDDPRYDGAPWTTSEQSAPAEQSLPFAEPATMEYPSSPVTGSSEPWLTANSGIGELRSVPTPESAETPLTTGSETLMENPDAEQKQARTDTGGTGRAEGPQEAPDEDDAVTEAGQADVPNDGNVDAQSATGQAAAKSDESGLQQAPEESDKDSPQVTAEDAEKEVKDEVRSKVLEESLTALGDAANNDLLDPFTPAAAEAFKQREHYKILADGVVAMVQRKLGKKNDG